MPPFQFERDVVLFTSDMEQEANATGLHLSMCFC